MALIMDTISLSIIHALIDLECLAKFLKRTSTDISSERCRLRSNNDNNNNNNNHYYYYNIYVYSAISTQGVGGGGGYSHTLPIVLYGYVPPNGVVILKLLI